MVIKMALNENQIKAINKDNGNVAVIATAGSGKTTVIINRIKRLITECGVTPENIFAVTFSKKAKENIQNKLPDECCGANVETFHSVALKIVQDYAHGTYKLWVKSWEKEKCLFDICKGLGLCAVKEDMPYNDLLKFIATQKINMKKSDNLIYDIDLPFTNSNMKIIYDEYEEYKEHHAYIEFDDLLNMACEIFEESPETLEKYQNIYTYILADEFQDVSLNQALFLKHLSAKNNNLFVVGDGCQAIYQFRGGVSKYLLEFDTEWSGADTINLNTNYRCSKDIVTTANELAKYLPESKNKHYVEAIANKEANSKPIYIECNTASEESNIVADEISKLVTGGKKYEDIAVLARTNAQLQYFESEFAKRKIPYLTYSDTSFIEKAEIKLIISYIKLAFDTKTDSAFAFCHNKPNRWLNKAFFDEVSTLAKKKRCSLYDAMFMIDRRNWRFKNGIDEIYEIVNKMQNKRFANMGEIVHMLRRDLNIDDFVSRGKLNDDGRYAEQIENLDTFEDTCKQFKTYTELKSYLLDIQNSDIQTDDNKVSLMTIHKSKGLEFPVVFLVGCSEGLLPHSKATDIDDEMRLMYVGITRAMDKLYLTSNLFYNSRNLMSSSFIDLLGDTIDIRSN